MTVKVGINGFGRIGRNFLRAALEQQADIQIVGVNDLTDNATLANLIKYDSIGGVLPYDVSHDEDSITVGDNTFKAYAERDPKNIPWGEIGADVVIELMGGIEPARTLILRALAAGTSVVTGNKALLAQDGASLYEAADVHGVDLSFEAAVAGAGVATSSSSSSSSSSSASSAPSSYSSDAPAEDGGTLASDEALAALREKLTGN